MQGLTNFLTNHTANVYRTGHTATLRARGIPYPGGTVGIIDHPSGGGPVQQPRPGIVGGIINFTGHLFTANPVQQFRDTQNASNQQ